MENDMYVLAILIALVAVSGCVNNSQDNGDTTLEVPVGEDAWGEERIVNISDSLDPAEVSLRKSETLVWVNKNNFNTTVRIRGTNKDFKIPPKGRQSFKPATEFEYEIFAGKESLDSGKVVVRSNN